VLIKSMI